MSNDLALRFEKAVYLIRNGPPQPDASTEQKLKVYSMFKQATIGDVNIPQPWAFQVEARAKWDAWAALKGTSKETAMEDYINYLAQGDTNWENHEALKNFQPGSVNLGVSTM
eukprot:TRINITY_DN199_c0_g1_i2.p1 TRINITY_DN199_c0_g1~~TRINITY_DN199_c0_g1_i2.p1  ORF type:complete len:126 (-),score=43.51 TRINITY_DN199_c0_g1_i2:49-384(-)